jgi:hypothetical protein
VGTLALVRLCWSIGSIDSHSFVASIVAIFLNLIVNVKYQLHYHCLTQYFRFQCKPGTNVIIPFV